MPETGRETEQPPPVLLPLPLPPSGVTNGLLVPVPVALMVTSGPMPPTSVTLIFAVAAPSASGAKVTLKLDLPLGLTLLVTSTPLTMNFGLSDVIAMIFTAVID